MMDRSQTLPRFIGPTIRLPALSLLLGHNPAPALWRACFTRCPRPVFQHAGRHPSTDQSPDALITTLASYRVRWRTAAGGGASGERHAGVADPTHDHDDQVRQQLAACGGQIASRGESSGATVAVGGWLVRRRA